jgi:hypothetical protein
MRTRCLGMFSRICELGFGSFLRLWSADEVGLSVGLERLAPEVAHVRPFYSWVGGGAGAG